MTAIGTTWKAVLASDQRGPLVTFTAGTQREALAHGQALLDRAKRFEWFKGETIRVEVGQSDD